MSGTAYIHRLREKLAEAEADRDRLQAELNDALRSLTTVVKEDGVVVSRQARELQTLRDALEQIEEDARQGKIASESVTVDQEWPVHDTIHRFSVIRAKARAALATPDTPPPTSYEFDGKGRAYARYSNGEVLPTGYTARSFAGKSDVTPERFREIAAPDTPPDATQEPAPTAEAQRASDEDDQWHGWEENA